MKSLDLIHLWCYGFFQLNLHKIHQLILSLQNKNHITLSFQANIWKILLNIENSLLVVELRDEELRQTSFVGINLKNGKILWTQNKLQEKWWIGLLETKGNFVLLHGYKDLQTPIHLKTYVLNVLNGDLLWKNESTKPIGFSSDNTIVGQEEQESDYLMYNPNSGKVVKQISPSSYIKDNQASSIVNPNYYSIDNKYFEKIAHFIQHLNDGLIAEEALEYLEYNGKIITSFYAKKAEKFVNYISVVSEDGEVLLLEELGRELNAVSADTFFLVKEKLVYLKNKKELVIFEL